MTVATALEPRWVRGVVGLVDLCFVFLGAWTLLCWGVVLSGHSFDALVRLAWLPCAATAAFAGWRESGSGSPAAPAESLALGEAARAGLAGLLVVAAYAWSGSYLVFWALALGLGLVAWRRAADPGPEPAAVSPGRDSPLALLAVCAVAVAVTLASHRPDPDDSFYLNLVATALDRPGEALLGFDGMFGDAHRPLFGTWYRLKSYEPLVATLVRVGGVAPEDLYYLAFPALFAALGVFVHWAALRALGGAFAALGAGVVVAVLVAWGDVHQAFGNFAFVRLFQGKAVTVLVSVPAAIWYATRFVQAPGLRRWILLALSQVAAVGISGSAIVAVPVAAASTLIGWGVGSRQVSRRGVLVAGLAASVVVGLFALAIFLVMSRAGGLRLSVADVAALPERSEEALRTVLGSGPRGLLALLALLVAPRLAPTATRRALAGYALVVLLVTMNPLVAEYLRRVAVQLTWRTFWAVPFPLLIGLCGQRLAALSIAPAGRRVAATAAVAALVGAFAAAPGQWSVSEANGTRLGLPRAKVPVEYAIAGAIIGATRSEDLMLAPYSVAAWTAAQRRHPRLVGVRPAYFGPIGDPDEIEMRRQLVQAVTGGGRPAEALDLIRRLGVRVVVRWVGAGTAALADGLAAAGCRAVGDGELALPPATLATAGYQVWFCPP